MMSEYMCDLHYSAGRKYLQVSQVCVTADRSLTVALLTASLTGSWTVHRLVTVCWLFSLSLRSHVADA